MTQKTAMPPANQLDWNHDVSGIPSTGLRNEREATAAEREAIASALGLLALNWLKASYRIQPLAGGGYRLSGKVSANVDQACVITLDPVNGALEDAFDVEFWPEVTVGTGDEEASVLEGPDVEKIEDGAIPAGRIIFETFSAGLDPFPRREGAEFNWQDPLAADPEKVSPFAALSKLKGKE